MPGICPRCDQSDRVHDVESVFAAGRGGSRPAGDDYVDSFGGWTSSLLDPVGNLAKARGLCVVASIVTIVLIGTVVGMVIEDPPVDGSEAAGYALLPALSLLVTGLFVARWVRHLQWNRQLRVSQSAYELWATAWYCYRCQGVFFPAERPGIPTTEFIRTGPFRKYIRAEARSVRRQ